jgi:hypothetical protein
MNIELRLIMLTGKLIKIYSLYHCTARKTFAQRTTLSLRVRGLSWPCRPGRGYEIILALTACLLYTAHYIALLRTASFENWFNYLFKTVLWIILKYIVTNKTST